MSSSPVLLPEEIVNYIFRFRERHPLLAVMTGRIREFVVANPGRIHVYRVAWSERARMCDFPHAYRVLTPFHEWCFDTLREERRKKRQAVAAVAAAASI